MIMVNLKSNHAVTLALVVLLLGSTTLLAFSLISSAPRITTSLPEEKPKEELAAPQSFKNFASLAKSDIFGAPSAPGKDKRRDASKLPVAKLGALLVGTVASDESGGAYAIFQIKNQQELYHVGDKIGNSTIVDIQRRSVVLNTSGRDEAVTMPE